MKKIDSFKIIGIDTETTNANGKASIDIGILWERFFKENILGKIPNKIEDEIYCIYTDYESDYTGTYRVILGVKVSNLDQMPNGLIGREFHGGKYQKYSAKGEMPHAVVATWQEIWAKDKEMNRKYTADFEVYGPKSQLAENSEVEIFIAM